MSELEQNIQALAEVIVAFTEALVTLREDLCENLRRL